MYEYLEVGKEEVRELGLDGEPLVERLAEDAAEEGEELDVVGALQRLGSGVRVQERLHGSRAEQPEIHVERQRREVGPFIHLFAV